MNLKTTVLLLLLNTVWTYDYIGCFSRIGVLDGQEGELQGPMGADCRANCASKGLLYTYEYIRRTATRGTDQYCLCSDNAPDYQYLTNGWNTCESRSGLLSDVTVSMPLSPYTFDHCYPPPPDDFELGRPVSTLLDCLAICSSRYARMTFDKGKSTGHCSCYPTSELWAGSTWTNCRYGDWFIYEQPLRPSAFVKEDKNHRDDVHDQMDFCPEDLVACKLPNGQGYECLDISLDSESCGGCLYGEFEDDNDPRVGINRTALPGVTMFGVMCREGRCIVSSCEGFTLVDR